MALRDVYRVTFSEEENPGVQYVYEIDVYPGMSPRLAGHFAWVHHCQNGGPDVIYPTPDIEFLGQVKEDDK
ncbi:hypothetical protein [Streptomyces sp. URMC 125]|uniref:hypothetical protein n=1 Tax=Streptomyces sp. URMC 125 TaxID=3423419 RepID=UPI003F1D7510